MSCRAKPMGARCPLRLPCRHIVVVDENNYAVGIVTRRDLAHAAGSRLGRWAAAGRTVAVQTCAGVWRAFAFECAGVGKELLPASGVGAGFVFSLRSMAHPPAQVPPAPPHPPPTHLTACSLLSPSSLQGAH